MSDTLIGAVPVISLTRKRGDTKSIAMTLKDSAGAVIDVTGYTFELAVNADEEPSDVTNQVFTTTGVIVDAPNGRISFPVDAAAADNLGEYFYDAQLVDLSGESLTFIKGSFAMTQDITKT